MGLGMVGDGLAFVQLVAQSAKLLEAGDNSALLSQWRARSDHTANGQGVLAKDLLDDIAANSLRR